MNRSMVSVNNSNICCLRLLSSGLITLAIFITCTILPPLYGIEDKVSPGLIKQLQDTDWYLRQAAAEVLGESHNPLAVQPLLVALKDEHPEVRKSAAMALGKIGDPGVVEPLIHALSHIEDGREAEYIIRALAELGDPRAVQPIAQALQRKDLAIEPVSVREITTFHDSRIGEALLRYVTREDGNIDFNVANMMVSMNDSRILEPLVLALSHAPCHKQWRAADALGRLGDPRAIEPLINALDSDATSLCSYAARSLGKIGDDRAVEPLIKKVRDTGEDIEVRISAIQALGRIGNLSAIEPLEEIVGSITKSPDEKASTNEDSKYLVGINKDDIEKVKDAISNALADIWVGGYRALAQSGKEAALKTVSVALVHDEATIRSAGVRVLQEIRSDEVIPLLEQVINDVDRDVRYTVVETLSMIPGDASSDLLTLALKDEDENVRDRAAKTLAQRSDPYVISYLTRLGNTEQGGRYAGNLLKDFERSSPELTEVLIVLIQNPERHTREDTADVLARLAEPSTLEAILAALQKEQDLGIRRDLARALGRINDPRSVKALEKLLEDDHVDVQRWAAHSLARLGWKPGNENHKMRFMVATGRDTETGSGVPRAEVVGTGNRLESAFSLDTPIISKLTVGIGQFSKVVMIHRVEFNIKNGELKATLQVSHITWPSSEWDIRVELLDGLDSVIVQSSLNYRVEGMIISVPMVTKASPHEISFGKVETLDRVKRFAIVVENTWYMDPDDPRSADRDPEIDRLVEALNSTDKDVWTKAIRSLANKRTQRTIDILDQVMRERDTEQRYVAIWALGDTEDSRAVQPLAEMLGGEDEGIQQRIIGALRDIGDKKIVELFQHPHMYRRLTAARALDAIEWKPTTEGERILYLLALDKGKEAQKSAPSAQPVEGKPTTVKGLCIKAIPIFLSFDMGIKKGESQSKQKNEVSTILDVPWIMFSEKNDNLDAVLYLKFESWPHTKWLVKVRIFDKNGSTLSQAEQPYENTGIITTIPYIEETILHFKFEGKSLTKEAEVFECILEPESIMQSDTK